MRPYDFVIKCPACKVECEVTKNGFFLNDHQCPELGQTEFAVKPTWCPRLADVAPEGIFLMPESYRARIEGAIAASKNKRG